MFRRVELIHAFTNRQTGESEHSKQGLMGLSPEAVAAAWIDRLRGPSKGIPLNVRFYFTEKGWREVGRHVVAECQRSGQPYRVLAIKEKSIEVVWRDKGTGLEVAVRPLKPRA